MKVLFGMALRQTTGFVESLLRLIDLDWAVPDYSPLCRCHPALAVDIPYRGSQGPLHLLIDSTGIKAEGEGEWHARKHGGTNRRLWRKIHLGIDEETLEVRAVEITGSHVGDAPMLPELLDQLPPDEEIGLVTGDGAYDTRKCHDAIADRGAHAFAIVARTDGATMAHYRRAGTPSPGGRPPPEPWRETRPCGHRNTLAAPSGDDGADTTAGAASKPGCTA